MKTGTTKRAIAILLTLCTLLSTLTIPAFAEGNWKPSYGNEAAENDTRIYVVTDYLTAFTDAALHELDSQANLFAVEYNETLDKSLSVVYGTAENAKSNDIVLVVNEALNIPAQGYSICVAGTKLTVSASDADGIFYGWRNVLKQLIADGSVSSVEVDAPDVEERSVSLDNGRKYFSVEWIKELIREMSWANMNTLVLHFSEEMGLGIESKTYPWLAGRDGTLCTQAEVATDNTVLTQDEVREIVEYAHLYNIDVVPAFDSPGHMNYIVKKVNEQAATQDYSFTYGGMTYTLTAGSEIGNYFHYNGKTSIVKGSRNAAYSRGIDISNDVAVAFTQSLLTEYATLFAELGCTKFDIGGDELLGWGSAITSSVSRWKQLDHWKAYAIERTKNSNAVAYDAFLLYMNDLNDLVRGLGYTSVRMWNDDALRSSDTGWSGVVQLDTNIDIWYWTTGSNTVWTYLNAGYQVYNLLSDYNYYAMTSNYFSDSRSSFAQAYADEIYNEWNPYVFDPSSTTLGTGQNTALGNANVLGGAFGIWCDNPTLRTQDEVMEDILPLIRANAAKSWDALANASTSYKNFTAQYAALGSVPDNADPDTLPSQIPDTTELKKLIAESEEVVANKDQYVAVSYENYMRVVEEAKLYYTGVNLLNFTQAHVDAMADTIAAAKANLYTTAIADPLQALIFEYSFEYRENHINDPYTLETWVPYMVAVQAAERMIAEGSYDAITVYAWCQYIRELRNALVSESTASIERVDGIISAGFQTSYVYSGGTARLTVNTDRSLDVNISGVSIFDEQGNVLMNKLTVTEGAYNRRKPTIRTYYVDMNMDLAPGTYTFRVYGTVNFVDENGEDDFLYTADYVDCTIVVK